MGLCTDRSRDVYLQANQLYKLGHAKSSQVTQLSIDISRGLRVLHRVMTVQHCDGVSEVCLRCATMHVLKKSEKGKAYENVTVLLNWWSADRCRFPV